MINTRCFNNVKTNSQKHNITLKKFYKNKKLKFYKNKKLKFYKNKKLKLKEDRNISEHK